MTPATQSSAVHTVATTAHRVCSSVLLIFSIGLLYLAMRMLLSDISGYQADAFINDWRARGQIGSQPAWDAAHHAAQRSIDLSPVESAALFLRMGTVYEWQHGHSHPGDPEARESRMMALDAYRKVVTLRPTWPYSWLRLTQIKMELLQFDAEFDHAIQQSVHFGRSRPRVNFRIAMIGLTSWHELSDDQRALILDAATRSIKAAPLKAGRLIEFAESVHLLSAVCSAVTSADDVVIPLCPPLSD